MKKFKNFYKNKRISMNVEETFEYIYYLLYNAPFFEMNIKFIDLSWI